MLKGCQRKIIVLKNTGSNIFEEAYFVIRESAGRAHISEADMIAEANRIIKENGTASSALPKKKWMSSRSVTAAVILLSVSLLVLSVGFLVRAF